MRGFSPEASESRALSQSVTVRKEKNNGNDIAFTGSEWEFTGSLLGMCGRLLGMCVSLLGMCVAVDQHGVREDERKRL